MHQSSRSDGEAAWPSDAAMIKLSRNVLVNHYETRDINEVMRPMADDLTWIGPLENMCTFTAADMRAVIEPEYGTRVSMVDEYWGIRVLPSARVVLARYGLVAEGTGVEDIVYRQSATFVWAKTPAGLRVVHLHLSNSFDVPPRLDQSFVPGEDGIAYTIDATEPIKRRKRIQFETTEGALRFVGEDRILSVEAEGRGCVVIHNEGVLHATDRLVQVERRLPAWFVRTHRSCIVNAHRVVSLSRFSACMDDNSERPIAERRYLEVAEAIEAVAERTLRNG